MIEVIGWIGYDEIEEGFEESFGGLGGFFENGMRFNDYRERFKEKCFPYIDALQKSIVENEIKVTGADHQGGGDYVPVFNDGTYASFSYRAWGDLLAATWSEAENKDYNYMNFYC